MMTARLYNRQTIPHNPTGIYLMQCPRHWCEGFRYLPLVTPESLPSEPDERITTVYECDVCGMSEPITTEPHYLVLRITYTL